MSIDVRLNPDFHDKTTEQMLYDLAITDHFVMIDGKGPNWTVGVSGVSVTKSSLYEAVLAHHKMYFPFGDDI